MKVCVFGNGLLAQTTATCCARHFEVVREPSRDCDVLWLCDDTPIMPDGFPGLAWIDARARIALAQVDESTTVILSSQVPLGTTSRIASDFPGRFICYSPENIRVAHAVDDFAQQSRIVVGVSNLERCAVLRRLLSPFATSLIFTTVETAEMVKHALNCWLGLQIAWINEIARIAQPLGVEMAHVTTALLTERRISPVAPLHAGQPFRGGHLARDIRYLEDLAHASKAFTPILDAILTSNTHPL